MADPASTAPVGPTATCCWNPCASRGVHSIVILVGGIIGLLGIVLLASHFAPQASQFHQFFSQIAVKMGTKVPILAAITIAVGGALGFGGVVLFVKHGAAERNTQYRAGETGPGLGEGGGD